MNPGSSSPAAKPNASATIAAAAEALTAKARESVYTTNPAPNRSPERSLIKGQYHKRMQSLQNNSNANIRDRNAYLDGSSSLERSPERLPRTPAFDYENRSPERSPTRTSTPNPSTKDFAKDPPNLRPASRPPLKAILGENTPPSATMLALQNTPTPKEIDTSLSNITNNSSAMMRNPHTFDAISNQILSLTGIATNLQREMTQLSRRSKDNATDLISLKEATNLRDEDIRKSLRDLASNLSSRLIETGADSASRAASHYSRGPGSFLIDNKPHVSPSGLPKSFSLPRIPSPNSFSASLEREISTSPYNMDGAASIALLEKVLREMGTKEGQERLFASLVEIQDRTKIKDSDGTVVKKLEEILGFLKEANNNRALITRKDNGNGVGDRAPKLELEFDTRSMSLARVSREATPQSGRDIKFEGKPAGSASGIISDDMLKMLKKMKDSIAEGGGMTAELKALVRELRGEVLGMGREIGRKLDQAESLNNERNQEGGSRGPGPEEIAQIVEEGLANLKVHMEAVMREKRRQSSSSTVSRSTVDSQEVYTAVKSALNEIPFQQLMAMQNSGSGIEREEILEAVREAWETYKPEIELQNFGLERDEILQCLKEGLHEYRPKDEPKELAGASYDEVLDAVHEGLKNFKPPAPIETEASITKDEILMTVRECLDTFEFPTSSVGAPRELEMTREDVLDAVKEGLSAQPPISKEIEFNRDDLFEAIRAGLEGARTPMGGIGEQVLDKMQDLLDGMRAEFKQYSAANGGDTEQVLDAMKDGLEVLRADIETYVDRAADVTGKDEIIETVRDGLDHLRNDLEASISNSSRDPGQSNNGELLDAMEKEFEHLRQTIATSMLRVGSSDSDRDEILDTFRDGIGELKVNLLRTSDLDSNTEAIHGMKEEFEHLRETLTTTLVRGSSSGDKEEILETLREGLDSIRANVSREPDRPESILSGTGEILDAMNDGLEGLRADVERMVNKPLDMTVNYEILDTLKEGLVNVRADIDRLNSTEREVASNKGGEVVIADADIERNVENLRRNDIENLEVMIAQLRIKVESLDNMPPPPPPPPQPAPAVPENTVVREDLEGIEATLRDVHVALAEFTQREQTQRDDVVTKDDTDAIENLLRNTKAKIDEMTSTESDGLARVIQLEAVESLMKETRDAVHDFGTDKASKDDLGLLEVLLQEVRAGLDEMREKMTADHSSDRVIKSDLEILESLGMETKSRIEELVLSDVNTLPTKVEVEALGGLIKVFSERREEDAELTARAFEARKIEHGGIADKIEDVKLFLDDVRAELKAKLNEDSLSIQELAKTLETFTDTVVGSDAIPLVNELKEVVTRGFESVHGNFAGSELEREEKHSTILEKHDEHKTTIIAELNSKIDERFDEIMTKYDDAQLAAEEKERALRDKDIQQTEALNTTKTIAEDLRLLVDTLGSTVTDSCDRMGEDSKTVFERIENMGAKLDGLIAYDGKTEHQLTRAEISKTMTGVEGVQAHVTEYQPKILEAVKEVLNIVGQHYEQAKTSTEEIKTSVRAIPAAIPLPAIAAPPPTPPIPQEVPVFEKYDDLGVHTKLDQLVGHAGETGKSLAQLTMLDQIRDQVMTTANDFNNFVAQQQATITQAANDRTKEMEEVSIALQKRISQKEGVEADIVRISDQRHELMKEVEELLLDKDDLITQKSKLQADLSSIRTALEIRREELHNMEIRADGLERRILDGVLNHSRSLLTTSRPSSLKDMNLKRVVSSASNATTDTRASTVGPMAPSYAPSALSSGIGMALKRRQPVRNAGSSAGNSNGDRRILSLSTLGGNKGVNAEKSMILAHPSHTDNAAQGSAFGIGGVKRSHSVKSNFPMRKASWGGTKALGMYADEGVDGDDKENSVLDEEDENVDDTEGSESGTERRTSYSGTYTGSMSYGDGSTVSGYDRRTSYAPSTVGTLGTKEYPMTEDGEVDSETESIDEGEEDPEHKEELEPEHENEHEHEGSYPDADVNPSATKGEISNAGEMVVFGQPSDSGIGTEIPTAGLEGGKDYFRDG